jgi:hypothetical protein
MQSQFYEDLYFANKELGWDFGKDHFKADQIVKYFIFIGENDEGYQRFLKMLAHVKTSTLYRNQTIRKQLTDYLKLIEHELKFITINGNPIMILKAFIDLIFQCNYINNNYVKYLPLCDDFEKL